MDEKQVPQDQSRTYGGHSKLLYAKTDGGGYKAVTSSGWEAEEAVTLAAVEELGRLAKSAWHAANDNVVSPLQYHMYTQRMDISLLSQVTGLFQWRIRRHFRPQVFTRLSDTLLERYGDALGIEVSALKQLPDAP
jgi:hypothetical protein